VQHLLEYIERLVNMSRVFRRPMFRKGGGVNMNGIMSGIEDRQNFSTGTPQTLADLPSIKDLTAENIAVLQEAGGERAGFDPFTAFLLQYGPQAATQTGGGGLIGNLVAAAKDPVDTLIKDKRDEDRYQRELRTQAAGAAIKQANEMRSSFEDRKFKEKMFKDETDRLLTIQEKDFSQEAKMLGLKQDFSGSMFDKERDLKLNMQKIDNAFRSGMLTEEQKNKLEILNKQYENSLGLLEAELAGTTGISKTIEDEAKKLVEDGSVSSYSEAKNQKTWQYETSGELMNQGYNVSDELLVESIVNDPKKFTQKAKKLSKKPGNEGRIFYFPKGDQYFILEGGAFKPFELPGAKKDNSEETLKKTNNVTEEVDGITNYEYGTGDKRDQTRDIRQKTAQLKGPINNPNRLYDTSMNKGQKSAYERYLSDYRNQ
jgi:hypothetical protein